jgi:hypothetical protein
MFVAVHAAFGKSVYPSRKARHRLLSRQGITSPATAYPLSAGNLLGFWVHRAQAPGSISTLHGGHMGILVLDLLPCVSILLYCSVSWTQAPGRPTFRHHQISALIPIDTKFE